MTSDGPSPRPGQLKLRGAGLHTYYVPGLWLPQLGSQGDGVLSPGPEMSEPFCPPWEEDSANRELSLKSKRELSGGWDDHEKLAPLARG